MKRFLLSILMVVIGLSAFSQSPSRLISLRPAYPLAIGESTVDGIQLSNSGLYMQDVYLDSLPHYEIGQIFEQTVRYSLNGHGFYVKADSLKSLNVSYSYEVKNPPQGTIEFNESTGRFKYYPAVDDYKMFTVTFTATNGTESVSEEVEFSLMPKTPSEEDAFSTQGTMPDAGDYTIIAESSKSMYFNNMERTAYSISIAGKDVIFDDAIQNKVWGLSGREDIYELNIYAERLIVRSELSFPGTKVTVYAKQLIFEDKTDVFAFINTTPPPEKTLTDGVATAGQDGGNITLHIKEFKSNPAIRLMANGGKGQSTNRNGTPGRGGNGGVITSTVDIGNYCDFVRGSGGVKYDVAGDGSTEAGPIIEYAEIGNAGRFRLINKPYAYLHPYYLSAVMRYANDAFINNHIEITFQICHEYRTAINEYLKPSTSDYGSNHEGILDDLDALNGNEQDSSTSTDYEGILDDLDALIGNNQNSYISTDYGGNYEGILDDLDDIAGNSEFDIYDDTEDRLGLQNSLIEINKMLFKLEQGLDYFGNPVGWVPLLSFEVMLANYNVEIDRAVPTLYMYYWLNRVDRTLQDMVKASELAAGTTEQEFDANLELLNSLVLEIPVLQDEIEEVARMVAELTERIEILQQQLMAQAVKNVKKRNRWGKLFGIGKVVANVVSAIPGWGTAVGTALNTGLDFVGQNINYLTGDDYDYSTYMSYVKSDVISDTTFTSIITTLKNAKTCVSNKDFKGLSSACKSMFKTAKPLYENLASAFNILRKNSAPSSEVEAEYNRLIASSSLWNELKTQVEELNVKKDELMNHMNDIFSDMTTTMSDLNNNILALDAFRRDAFTGNSKRDLNAMLYLEEMEQRAKDRLLLYDYYLRKAYEYRLLKEYKGEFNLVSMFERFETLGGATGDMVDESAYSTLKSVFRERISDMTQEIVSRYNSNYPEQSAPISLVIPKDQLNTINAEEGITLNFHEMGIFASDEENVRIVNLEIEHLDTHVEGNLGVSGYMDLNLTHSGISTFRKDGHLYWFDHRSRNTTSPHTWGMRYNVVSNETTTVQPSAASTSLLRSIVNTDDIMMFSRPSAWSNVALTKKVHSTGNADVVIDSLVIKLQYDFTRRPDNIRNIDITTSDGLLPFIACSEEDITGRSNGNGHLYRSYTKSSQNVTFTAVDKYGTYHFKNWTDRAGNIVSTEPALTVNRQKDQFYTANYERRIPVLNVPNTIKVGNDGGTFTVHVANVGQSDIEMDWYVSDSLSTWVHLNGEAEGIDDGSFTFTFEANEAGTYRIDSLEIIAPETDEMFKKIYIVQDIDLSQYPNLLYVDDHNVFPGQRFEIPIKLKNNVDVAGVSLALKLPKGMTVAKDSDGDVICSLNGERAKSNRFYVMSASYDDGSYGFRIMPTTTTTISGTDGIVLKIAVDVARNLAKGDYEVKLMSNSLSVKNCDGSATTLDVPDTHFTLSVVDGILGDVNADGRIDLTDAIMVVYHSLNILQPSFMAQTADMNGDGRIDLTDAINIVYKSLGAGQKNAPYRLVEPE